MRGNRMGMTRGTMWLMGTCIAASAVAAPMNPNNPNIPFVEPVNATGLDLIFNATPMVVDTTGLVPEIRRQDDGSVLYRGAIRNNRAVFKFENIDQIGNTIFVQGGSPVTFLATGDASLRAMDIIANASGRTGGPGGGDGGAGGTASLPGSINPGQPGDGPGAGEGGSTASGNRHGGNASFGGQGQSTEGGAPGSPYGDLAMMLEGGSGGGGGGGTIDVLVAHDGGHGGGGGGAVEIGVAGTLTLGGGLGQLELYADGADGAHGTGSFSQSGTGGGGSGGAILIHANQWDINLAIDDSSISAQGGVGHDFSRAGNGHVLISGHYRIAGPFGDLPNLFQGGDTLQIIRLLDKVDVGPPGAAFTGSARFAPQRVTLSGGSSEWLYTAPFIAGASSSGDVLLDNSLLEHVTFELGSTLAFDGDDNIAFTASLSGAGHVDKRGSGVLFASGSWSHTLDTHLREGALQTTAPGVLSPNSVVVVDDGANLFVGAVQTVANLRGEGGVSVLAGSELRLGTNDQDQTFDGRFTGSGLVTKQGTGTFTMTNSSPFFSSNSLLVEAGRFDLAAGGLMPLAADVTLLNDAILERSGGGLRVNNAAWLVSDDTHLDINGALQIRNGGQMLFHDNARLDVANFIQIGHEDTAGQLHLLGGVASTAGSVTINSMGELQIDSGHLEAQSLDNTAGGTLDLRDGTLVITGGVLAPVATGNFLIDAESEGKVASVELHGGASVDLGSNNLNVGRDHTGQFELRGGATAAAHISFVGRFAGAADSQVIVDGAGSTWALTGNLNVGGDPSQQDGGGRIDVTDGGHVAVDNNLRVFDNAELYLDQGSVEASSILVDGTLSGAGAAFGNVTGSGTIHAAGPLVLGNASSNQGVNFTGTLTVGSHSVTLLDANEARLGGLTTLAGGTLNAANGLAPHFTSATIQGYGVIIGEMDDGISLVRSGSLGEVTTDFSVQNEHRTLFGGPFALNAHATVESGGVLHFDAPSVRIGDGSEAGRLTIANSAQAITAGPVVLGIDAPGSAGAGRADVTGGGSQWTVDGMLTIGRTGQGQLHVTNGGEVRSQLAAIATENAGTGQATVSGSGSQWRVDESLFIGGGLGGGRGTGVLTVANGAAVTVGDQLRVWGPGILQHSGGTIAVSSDGSASGNGIFVGLGTGEGELWIVGGGQADTAGPAYLGYSQGSTGTANVRGNNTLWSMPNHNLVVGEAGHGVLDLRNNATLISGIGTIGEDSTSLGEVTVAGATSNWQIDANLRVGRSGDAHLTITGGGRVTTGNNSNIAVFSGSSGEVLVSGADSTWDTANNLNVGGSNAAAGGTGMLTIEAGGQVNIGGVLRVWQDGTLELQGGGVAASQVDHTHGGEFHFTGGILTVETFDGNLLNQGGMLAPGNSLGATHVLGDYTQQASASLQIEIGGPSPGSEFDLLSADGSATLDGTLDVLLLDGFMPEPGQVFEFLTAGGGISGTFANELLPVLASDSTWNVNYGSNSVVLEVLAPGPAGDFNGNGIVDAADYTVWRDGLGTDFSHADYDLWASNFGAAVGAAPSLDAASHVAVPEPSPLLLLLAAAVLPALRRGCRSA